MSPPPALSHGDAIGGGVVYCRWGAMEGLGGAARALQCVSNGPRGGGASLAVMRLGVGVGAWGGVSPLPSALLPCARAGLCARGASPRDAKGADAVTDRAALGGAVCVGWVPRVVRGDAGRAGLTATGGCRAAPPWLLCVAFGRAHVPARWGGGYASPLPADVLPSSSSSEPTRLSRSVSGSEEVEAVACREAMKRASLSFRTRSKLCCSGGAVRVLGSSRRGRYWDSPGDYPSVTCWSSWSSSEKSKVAGAACQAGGTLLGSECERAMISGLGLGTGGEALGLGVPPRPRACAGRAKLSDVVRTSRLGSLRGPVGTGVAGV